MQEAHVKKSCLLPRFGFIPGTWETWRDIWKRLGLEIHRVAENGSLFLHLYFDVSLPFWTCLAPSVPFLCVPTRRYLRLMASFGETVNHFGPILFAWTFTHQGIGTLSVLLETNILSFLLSIAHQFYGSYFLLQVLCTKYALSLCDGWQSTFRA